MSGNNCPGLDKCNQHSNSDHSQSLHATPTCEINNSEQLGGYSITKFFQVDLQEIMQLLRCLQLIMEKNN